MPCSSHSDTYAMPASPTRCNTPAALVPPEGGSLPPTCGQDREIRRLGRGLAKLEDEVHGQETAGVRLEAAVQTLAATCERLERVVERLATGRPTIGQQIAAACIHWGVPLIGGAVIWLIAASGQVAHVSAKVAP